MEERTYERLGDPRPLTIDVRIVAATNRDLEDMVRDKLFRQDLYFRLSVVDLHIPALRHLSRDPKYFPRVKIPATHTSCVRPYHQPGVESPTTTK